MFFTYKKQKTLLCRLLLYDKSLHLISHSSQTITACLMVYRKHVALHSTIFRDIIDQTISSAPEMGSEIFNWYLWNHLFIEVISRHLDRTGQKVTEKSSTFRQPTKFIKPLITDKHQIWHLLHCGLSVSQPASSETRRRLPRGQRKWCDLEPAAKRGFHLPNGNLSAGQLSDGSP